MLNKRDLISAVSKKQHHLSSVSCPLEAKHLNSEQNVFIVFKKSCLLFVFFMWYIFNKSAVCWSHHRWNVNSVLLRLTFRFSTISQWETSTHHQLFLTTEYYSVCVFITQVLTSFSFHENEGSAVWGSDVSYFHTSKRFSSLFQKFLCKPFIWPKQPRQCCQHETNCKILWPGKEGDLLLFLYISVKLCCSFFSYHQKCPLWHHSGLGPFLLS